MASFLVVCGVVLSFGCALPTQIPVDVFWVPGPGRRSEAAFAVDPGTGMAVLHGGRTPGGQIAYGTCLWDGSRWMPATTNCGNPATPPFLLDQQLLVDVARQRLLLVGGTDGSWMGPYCERSIWQYRAGCWTQLFPGSSVTLPYGETTFAYDEIRDRIVAYRGTPSPSPTTSETWEWDGTAWLQRAPTMQPPPRNFAAMVFDRARQRTILFGGFDGTNPRNDTWEWDGTNWQQVATPSSPGPSYRSVLLYDAAQARCLLVGGSTPDLWSYDGATWTRLTNGGTPLGPSTSIAFDSARQQLLVFGGIESNAMWSAALFGWNGTTWQVLAPASAPSPGHGITHVQRGTAMVVAGGNTMELWERGTTGWSCLATNGSVPGRTDGAAAYDLARQRIVLFGGYNGSALDDTWEWDGTAWTQAQPSTRPSPREGASMAFDPVGGGVLLFGGMVTNGYVNDTWSWNGSAWVQQFPSTTPSPRALAPMACDPVRGVVVLHGGSPGLADTWEWNGATWQARPNVGGQASTARGAMAYDSRRNVVVFSDRHNFYITSHSGASWAQFWDWDGAAWTFQLVSDAFAPFLNAPCLGFTFDPRVQRCVHYEHPMGAIFEFGAVQALPSTTSLGPGCGAYPQPSLRVDPAYLDSAVMVSVYSAVTGLAGTFLLAGLSNTQWNGMPLPLDLTSLGATGCSLRIAPDVTSFLCAWSGDSIYWWHLPNAPQLVGMQMSLQGAILAPNANPAGLLLSNGLELTIGLR